MTRWPAARCGKPSSRRRQQLRASLSERHASANRASPSSATRRLRASRRIACILSKLTTQSVGTPSRALRSFSSETRPRSVRVSAATTTDPMRPATGSRVRINTGRSPPGVAANQTSPRFIRHIAPYAMSTHFKDHMVVMAGGQPVVVGVPLGKGSIDCAEAFRILAEHSPLERINIEVCYGYVAPFRLPEGEGHGAKLGQGSFRVQPPPHDPGVIAPYTSRSLDTDVERAGCNPGRGRTWRSSPVRRRNARSCSPCRTKR